MTCLLTTGALVAADPASAVGPVELNPTGGTGPSDGLRIAYGSGQIQVQRNGTTQMHATGDPITSSTVSTLLNGIYLRVGSTLVGPQHAGISGGTLTPASWTSVTATTPASDLIQSTMTYTAPGPLNYVVNLTLGYEHATDQYFTEYLTVSLPMGNTDVVKLYRTIDTEVDGSDTGAGFYDVTDTTRPTVGVRGSDPTHMVAIRRTSTPAWTGYWSGQSSCMYSDVCTATTNLGYLNRGLDFPASSASIDASAATNNGIGVEWDLAALESGAPHTVPVGIYFSFHHEIIVGELLPTVITFAQPADTPACERAHQPVDRRRQRWIPGLHQQHTERVYRRRPDDRRHPGGDNPRPPRCSSTRPAPAPSPPISRPRAGTSRPSRSSGPSW